MLLFNSKTALFSVCGFCLLFMGVCCKYNPAEFVLVVSDRYGCLLLLYPTVRIQQFGWHELTFGVILSVPSY